MYTPTVIEMMILEFLSGTNNDRIRYNGIKSSAFFSVIYESEFIRDMSESTVRRALNNLLSYDLVAYGMKSGKFYTYYITEKGLQWLAGCCSRCYGLRYSNKTLPQIGDNIGIETAQAIGEPAAQLTLSLVNKGGSAGESIASGVDILHRLLNGSSIKANSAGTDALVTRESGYLSVEKVNRNALLQLTKEDGTLLATKDALTGITMSTKIPYNLLICKNGEWVDAGSPVTAGYVMPDSIYKIPEKSTDKLIRYKQMVWCHNWYRNFIDNNIEVMARHFEVFARAQMSDVYIVKSDDPRFVEGKKYKYAEVVDAPGVIYTLNVNSIMETVISNSGALTAISFENLPSVLPSLVFNEHRSYSNADIGAINVGENLFSRKKVDLHSTPATSFVKQSEQQNMFTPAEFDFKQEKIEVATIDFGSLDELNLFGDTGLDTGDYLYIMLYCYQELIDFTIRYMSPRLDAVGLFLFGMRFPYFPVNGRLYLLLAMY